MPKGEKDSEEENSEDSKGSEEESKEEEKEKTPEEKEKEEEADELLSKKVKIGNREMTVGQLVKDHTGLQSEYTKGQQVLKDPDRLKAHLKSEFDLDLSEKEPESKSDLDEDTKAEIEAGRKLGFITKEDLATEKAQWKREMNLELELKDLENEIDGSDGRPEFKKMEVLDHMVKEDFREPRRAYEDLHSDELDSWRKKQEETGKKTPFTEKPTAGEVKLPAGKSPGKLSEEESRNLMLSMLEGKKA